MRPGENYGKISSNIAFETSNGDVKLVDLAKEKPLVLCFIDANREPTKHTLKELGAMKATFDKWGGNILLVIPEVRNTQPFDKSRWNLPKNTIVTVDGSGLLKKVLAESKQYFRDNYPLIFIADKEGNLVFKSEGYRIGTAELIYKTLTQIK